MSAIPELWLLSIFEECKIANALREAGLVTARLLPT